MLITVDTGGTKTLIASFERDGRRAEAVKFPTPQSESEYISQVRQTLESRYAGQPVEAIVIAVPGIVKNNVALECGSLSWRNFAVADQLQGILGNAPILIENDANLAGLGETRHLDPMPISSLYVTISTGIGTGMITGGHIDPGMRNSEGGHAMVEYNGEVRTWESFASGKAIRKAYGQYARDITSTETWDEIADRISRGFLAVVPMIQPDVVIIGGSIGTYFDQYAAQLEAILREKLPDYIDCPRFVEAKHPEEAVIYGCYYYALDFLAGN